jgi:multidrug efflux pump subunit AcrA (membrane-fusion protein)
MKKIISFTLLLTILLSSCWKKEEQIEELRKAEFYIDTILGSDASEIVTLKKTWQIRSWQDISLSSNASGRVSKVYVKTWDSVVAGQTLAVLGDNIWSYGINLERSAIWVERAQISYESTELSLDKTIFDAELNLDKLEKNLIALENDSKQNILLAQDNLDNSKYTNLNSSSALKLESLDNAIEKSKLDYEIKISTDAQSIEWYKATLKKEFSGHLTTRIDVQEFADNLLWVSEINSGANDNFEDFLGAQDKNQKRSSELSLQSMIDFKESDNFNNINLLVKKSDITELEMIDVIDFIDEWYDWILDVLNKLEVTLNNSLESEWNLGGSEISAYIASINWYQAFSQWAYGAYISVWTNMKSFLNTYKNSQDSILKSIELQEKDRDIQYKSLSSWELNASAVYERTVIGIEDNISNLESQIESAKKALDNAKRNKEITLKGLKNSISEAEVWYASSAKEYWKLTIKSPINGTIGSVLIDEGQELNQWMLAFEIVSNSTPEVEIAFSKWEKDLLSTDSEVELVVAWERYKWFIYAISEIADENLNYKATVIFESSVNLIGSIVNIEIPVYTGKMLLPLNILEVKWDDIVFAKTLSGATFSYVRMRTWEVFWEYIEVVSCAMNCEDLIIVTSDVSNYDENKFTITKK